MENIICLQRFVSKSIQHSSFQVSNKISLLQLIYIYRTKVGIHICQFWLIIINIVYKNSLVNQFYIVLFKYQLKSFCYNLYIYTARKSVYIYVNFWLIITNTVRFNNSGNYEYFDSTHNYTLTLTRWRSVSPSGPRQWLAGSGAPTTSCCWGRRPPRT